jgi:TolB-like protein
MEAELLDPAAASLPARRATSPCLPFVNASPDPDNEYLSDGITDELIDALAKVEGHSRRVATSVFALKGNRRMCERSVRLLD